MRTYCRARIVLFTLLLPPAMLFAQDDAETTPEATESVACTVRTEDANTVRLRVGPGENRTAFAFLRAGEDFAVLGVAEADNGSLWWKLDRETVAPTKSAAEAWVAQLDVEAAGDCDAVTDADAPPIIPITNITPPAATDEPESGGAASGDEVLPEAGSWTIVYPNSVAGSCSGGSESAVLNLGWPPESWNLSVSSDGATLTYAGKTFRRLSPGVYSGATILTQLSSPVSARVRLRVVSASQIAAQFTFTYTVEESTCNFVVNATMTRA